MIVMEQIKELNNQIEELRKLLPQFLYLHIKYDSNRESFIAISEVAIDIKICEKYLVKLSVMNIGEYYYTDDDELFVRIK